MTMKIIDGLQQPIKWIFELLFVIGEAHVVKFMIFLGLIIYSNTYLISSWCHWLYSLVTSIFKYFIVKFVIVLVFSQQKKKIILKSKMNR